MNLLYISIMLAALICAPIALAVLTVYGLGLAVQVMIKSLCK